MSIAPGVSTYVLVAEPYVYRWLAVQGVSRQPIVCVGRLTRLSRPGGSGLVRGTQDQRAPSGAGGPLPPLCDIGERLSQDRGPTAGTL